MVKIEIGNKKGQAALEYLMTYGWAILAVVVVLAVLWYLGIFTPKAPEMCVFDSPFSCVDGIAYVNSSTLKFSVGVQSVFVNTASIINVTLNGKDITDTCSSTSLTPDQKNTITCTHNLSLAKGSSFRGTITFQYTDKAGNKRTASGRFSGTVQ